MRRFHRFAPIFTQELNEAMRRCDIGARSVRRTPSIMEQMIRPARDQGTRRMIDQVRGSTSHRRMIAARLRPRNISNSEP